jgi:hypothetical protein
VTKETHFQGKTSRRRRLVIRVRPYVFFDREFVLSLVMALAEWADQAKHIPGSIHLTTVRETLQSLNKRENYDQSTEHRSGKVRRVCASNAGHIKSRRVVIDDEYRSKNTFV